MANHSLIITYDLKKPARNYQALYDAIKSAPASVRLAESVWLINTSSDAVYWRNKLKHYVDSDDSLAILGLNGSWATIGITSSITNWIRDYL